MENGFDMVISNGQQPEKLYDIIAGAPVGTLLKAAGGLFLEIRHSGWVLNFMTTLGQLQNAGRQKMRWHQPAQNRKNDALLAMADALEKGAGAYFRRQSGGFNGGAGALSVRLCWIVWRCLLRVSRTWRGNPSSGSPSGSGGKDPFRKRSGRMAWVICRTQVPMEW